MGISSSVTDVRVSAPMLAAWTERVFVASGVPPVSSKVVADCLVTADLKGMPSHGVSRIPIYIQRIRLGLVCPNANPKILRESPSALQIDAANGLGHPTASWGMRLCVEKARRTGSAVAGIFNSTHFGMAGYYAEIGAREGVIGIATSNSSPRMAPWGSRDALLGTNPLAIAVPGPDGGPIVLDMATSVAALGKIMLAAADGTPIPDAWALDADGHPTTDAAAALKGTVLPVGGPKGSGLAFMLDVLSGVLTGGSFGSQVRSLYRDMSNPEQCAHFLFAIDVEAFQPISEFRARMERYAGEFKRCRPMPGVSEVYLPGELERRCERVGRAEGLRLPSKTYEDLIQVARDTGVPFDWVAA